MDIDGFDQIKDFYQVGYNFNNSVAVSGGSQNSQSYFSYRHENAMYSFCRTYIEINWREKRRFVPFFIFL